MADCLSCKEERKAKGMVPSERIKLPADITDSRNFRKPVLSTYVCAWCDGEALVTSARKNFKARKGGPPAA